MSTNDLVEHHRVVAERFRADADRYQALLYQAWNTIRGQQKGLKRQARKLKALRAKLAELRGQVDAANEVYRLSQTMPRNEAPSSIEPSDNIATAERIQKEVAGALKSCVDAHGNIVQGSWIGSAAKRIAALLKTDFDTMADLLVKETERRVIAESAISSTNASQVLSKGAPA